MTLKRTTHIPQDYKNNILEHMVSNNFIENVDFMFEKTTHENSLILVLINNDKSERIFDTYAGIEESCFLIRMAKDRISSKFDVCTTFVGTIEACKQYLRNTFNLDEYAVKYCDYRYSHSIDFKTL